MLSMLQRAREQRVRVPDARQHRLHQHDPPAVGAGVPRGRGHRAADPCLHPVERRDHGPPRAAPRDRGRRAHLHLRLGRVPCTRWASTTSSAAGTMPVAVTRSSSRVTLPPACTPAPSSRDGSSESQLDRFRQEVSQTRARRRPSLLPAPAADAGLLGVPHRLDGTHAPQRDLPGAVQPVSAEPGHQGHQRSACLGLSRRRGDGRAGVARRDRCRGSGATGQPHLRRQLQPAAPRRAGPRKREDHPGTGGLLPRRRLERHQGHLGSRMGPPPGSSTPRAPWST